MVEVVLDRDDEFGEVAVADDSPKLSLGFEHAGGGPAQRHLARGPALDVALGAADDLDHRLAGVGRLERALERCRVIAEPGEGERLFDSFAQRAGGAGMRALELAGEPPELLERAGVIGRRPGAAEPLLDRRPVALGEMLEHVAFLVPETALHGRVAEDRCGSPCAAPWRRRSRTGSPARDRGRARPDRRAARWRRSRSRSLPSQSPSGILTPSVVIPSATTLVRPFSSIPSSIITARRTSSSWRLISSPSALAGALDERARDRRLRRRPRRRLDLRADRLLRAPVAARRDAGEHPLQHRLASADHGRRSARRSASRTSARRRRSAPAAARPPTRRPPSVTSPAS